MLTRLTILLMTIAVLLLAACSTPSATDVVIKSTAEGFSPATLEVKAGQPIRLTLDNTTAAEHQLAIKEIPVVTRGGGSGEHDMHAMGDATGDMADMNMYQVHMVTQGGQRMSIEMTPSKPGQYEFICMEPGHTERGTLIVK